jgi:hypothetical protein
VDEHKICGFSLDRFLLDFLKGEIYDQVRLIPDALAGHPRDPEGSMPREFPGRHLIEFDFLFTLCLIHQFE